MVSQVLFFAVGIHDKMKLDGEFTFLVLVLPNE